MNRVEDELENWTSVKKFKDREIKEQKLSRNFREYLS